MLPVSDRVSRGEAEDTSGATLEELLRADGYDVERRVVADERDEIAVLLRELAASAALVLTTGGRSFTRTLKKPATAQFWLKPKPKRYVLTARDAAGNVTTVRFRG